MTDLYKIKSEACKFFFMSEELFDSKSRRADVLKVRQITMAVARQCTKYSLSEIGLVIGHKDHATVLHACKKVKDFCETEEEYNLEFISFKERINLLLRNRNIITIEATITLKDSQFEELGYYFTYKGKTDLQANKTVKIYLNSFADIDSILNLNEIERIDINVVNKLIVAIMPTYQAVNEPIEIEI